MKKSCINKAIPLLALILFATTACGQSSAIAAEDQTSDFDNPTESSSAERTAQISEIEGEVSWRASQNATWQTATVGTILQLGSQLQTGRDGKVVVTFTEGTITRVIPNSIFSMRELSGDTENPVTTLELIKGQVYVIINTLLGNGYFKVGTSSGVASVRGSMLSLRLTPSGRLIITCLEGHCSLGNSLGLVELVKGQQAEISGLNLSPNTPSAIQDYQLNEWFSNYPDAVIVALNQNVVTNDFLPPGCDPLTGENCTLELSCDPLTGIGCELPPGCDPLSGQGCELPAGCNPITGEGCGIPPGCDLLTGDGCETPSDCNIITGAGCEGPVGCDPLTGVGCDLPSGCDLDTGIGCELPSGCNLSTGEGCEPDQFCTEFPDDPACIPEFCTEFPDDPNCGGEPPTATPIALPTATNTPPPTSTNAPPPTSTNAPPPTSTNAPPPTSTNAPPPTATTDPVTGPTPTEVCTACPMLMLYSKLEESSP